MSGFTEFCVWFLFICVVCETAWKGYNYYKLDSLIAQSDRPQGSKGVEEQLEEEVCKECGNIITQEEKVKDIKKQE